MSSTSSNKTEKSGKKEKSKKSVKIDSSEHIKAEKSGKTKLAEAGASAKVDSAKKHDPSDLGSTSSAPAPTIGAEESVTTKAGMIVTDNVKTPIVAEHQATQPNLEEAYPYPKRKLKSVLEREHPIGTISLGTANVRGNLLTTFDFPGAFSSVNNITNKLANFAFYRAGVQIRFRMASTSAASGKIKIGYLKSCPAGIPLSNYQFLPWLDPHILDVNSAQDLVITIPWFSNVYSGSTDWSSSSNSEIARVVAFCEHPAVISGATTPQSIEVQVYARLVDIDYWGDIPGAPISRALRRVPEDAFKAFLAQYSAQRQSVPMDLAKKVSTAFSDGDDSDIMSSLSATIETASAVMDGLAMFATKPLHDGVWKPAIVSQTGHISNATGIAPVPSVGWHQNVLLDGSDAGFFADIRKFDTINSIATMPGPIAYTSYNLTATKGQLLFRVPVTPSYCTDILNNTVGTFVPSPSGFISSNFNFWRGSMNYHLYVSSSQLAASKIMVCFFPTTASLPTTPAGAIDDQGEVTGFVLDVIGSVSKSFNIPYLNNIPTIRLLNPDECNVSDTGNAGFLEFRVLTPPKGNDAATTTIHVTLEAAAGSDSTWYIPTGRDGVPPDINQVVTYAPPVAFRQSLNSVFSKPFPTLDDTKSTFPSSRVHTDAPQSLKELACKPVPFQDLTAVNNSSFGPVSYPCVAYAGTDPGKNDVWLNLSLIFRGFRGGSYIFSDTWETADGTAGTVRNNKQWIYPVLVNPAQDLVMGYDGGSGLINLAAMNPMVIPTDVGFALPYLNMQCLFVPNEFCQTQMYLPSSWIGAAQVFVPTAARVRFYRAWADDVKWGGLTYPPAYVFPAAPSFRGKAKDKGPA